MAKYKKITINYLFSKDEFLEMEQYFNLSRKELCSTILETKKNQLVGELHYAKVAGKINCLDVPANQIYYLKDFFLGSYQSKFLDLHLIQLSTRKIIYKTISFPPNNTTTSDLEWASYDRWLQFNSSLFVLSK